jgi:Tfp pilus assembly protein PilV
MRTSDEHGFTIVECLAAALILVVGLLGTLTLMEASSVSETSTKAREGGVSLQRELTEVARSIPYDDLTPATVVAKIRAAGLSGSTVGGSGWTIQRRGVTYTMSVGVCSVDDPVDRIGNHDANKYCSTGTGSTTAAQCYNRLAPSGTGSGALPDCGVDINNDGATDGMVLASASCATGGCNNKNRDFAPDDYKRIVTLVRWDRGGGNRFAIQQSVVPNPGYSAGPRVTALTTGTTMPMTTGSSITFTATLNRTPGTVDFYVDGVKKGTVAPAAGATSVNWTWNMDSPKAQVDGTVVVSAIATDANGVAGQGDSLPVRINRHAPPATTFTAYGRNGLIWNPDITELEWATNPEGDVERYEVYKWNGTSRSGAPVCSTTDTTCAIPATSGGYSTTSPCCSGAISQAYVVVAVDTDSSGNTRLGANSPPVTVGTSWTNIDYPRNLAATTSGSNVVLTWSAAPDQTPPVDSYRVYRTLATNAPVMPTLGMRYELVNPSETSYVDTNTGGVQHKYWLTAVSASLVESYPVTVTR